MAEAGRALGRCQPRRPPRICRACGAGAAGIPPDWGRCPTEGRRLAEYRVAAIAEPGSAHSRSSSRNELRELHAHTGNDLLDLRTDLSGHISDGVAGGLRQEPSRLVRSVGLLS